MHFYNTTNTLDYIKTNLILKQWQKYSSAKREYYLVNDFNGNKHYNSFYLSGNQTRFTLNPQHQPIQVLYTLEIRLTKLLCYLYYYIEVGQTSKADTSKENNNEDKNENKKNKLKEKANVVEIKAK